MYLFLLCAIKPPEPNSSASGVVLCGHPEVFQPHAKSYTGGHLPVDLLLQNAYVLLGVEVLQQVESRRLVTAALALQAFNVMKWPIFPYVRMDLAGHRHDRAGRWSS